eukprot:m.33326 g.33326  ORF g.33326 m.33326 type:complete len:338 (-) comp5092_c0_seq1:211-1224(-)
MRLPMLAGSCGRELQQDDAMPGDRRAVAAGESAHVTVQPQVAHVLRAADADVAERGGDVDGSLVAIEEQHCGSVDELAGPYFVLVRVCSQVAGPDAVRLDAKRVLVDGDRLGVAEDGERLVGHLADVAANQQRRLHDAPQAEMRLVLLERHPAIANLEHVGVVPVPGARLAPEERVFVCAGDHALPVITDIASRPPAVTDRAGPECREVLAPLAERVEDRPAGLVERIAHDGIADCGRDVFVVTVVELEIVNPPGGKLICIRGLVMQRCRTLLAGHVARAAVDAKLEATRVNVVAQRLATRWERLRVELQVALRITLWRFPAVVQIQVLVAQRKKAS